MALNSNKSNLIGVELSEEKAVDRTSPVYVITDSQLALDDVTKPRPNDYNKQIDISWIDEALNQKSFEDKYASWDLISFPYNVYKCSAYGNGIAVFIGVGKAVLTTDNGTTWQEKEVDTDITTISYLEYKLDKVLDTGEVIVENIKKFVMLSSTGKLFFTKDNFETIEEISISLESYTSSLFSNNRFIAFTSTGKIFISDDYCETFKEIYSTDIQFISAACDENGVIFAVGNAGSERVVYSFDNGTTWQNLDNGLTNSYTDICYGEGRFIACSMDGAERLLIFEIDNENKSFSSHLLSLPYDYVFTGISYGSRVFVLISQNGAILSSLNGSRWIETSSAYTSYLNILRTDKFFIVTSLNNHEDGFNAVRSASGGISSILFATVQEIIDNEKSNLSIDIKGVNGWFNWLEQERGITSQDIRISYIDISSPFTDINELPAGYYIIAKSLNNLPEDISYNSSIAFFLKIFENDGFHLSSIKEKVLFYELYSFLSRYFIKYVSLRDFVDIIEITPENWYKQLYRQNEIENIDLSKDNVEVTKNSTISVVKTFLAVDNNGNVCNIESIDLSDNKIKVSQTITYSAVKTFLIVDNQGNVNMSSLEEIKKYIGLKKLAYKDIVESSDIKDNAVTESKILNGAVTTNKIKDNSVTDKKIKDNAVVESKILNGAVTTNKIKDGSVNNAKIASKTITYDKLNLSCIEFYNTSSTHGGYIDFHFNKSTADYTSRIIESASGKINITASSGLYVNNVKVLANINDLIALIKTKPAEIRNALGLGSLSTKNSINLADLTQTTGILPSSRGGFNYNDYLG